MHNLLTFDNFSVLQILFLIDLRKYSNILRYWIFWLSLGVSSNCSELHLKQLLKCFSLHVMNLARLYESFTFWNKLPKINHDILLFFRCTCILYTTNQKLGSIRFLMFWNNYLMFSKAAFIWLQIQWKQYDFEILFICKCTVFYFNVLNLNCIPVMAKLNFKQALIQSSVSFDP